METKIDKSIVQKIVNILETTTEKQTQRTLKHTEWYHDTFPWFYPVSSYCAVGVLYKHGMHRTEIPHDIWGKMMIWNDAGKISFKEIAQNLKDEYLAV